MTLLFFSVIVFVYLCKFPCVYMCVCVCIYFHPCIKKSYILTCNQTNITLPFIKNILWILITKGNITSTTIKEHKNKRKVKAKSHPAFSYISISYRISWHSNCRLRCENSTVKELHVSLISCLRSYSSVCLCHFTCTWTFL